MIFVYLPKNQKRPAGDVSEILFAKANQTHCPIITFLVGIVFVFFGLLDELSI